MAAATTSGGMTPQYSMSAFPSERSQFFSNPLFVMPGTSVMTSTSNRANSPRHASDMPTSANLLAEYSAHAGIPLRPHIDVMFTTAGWFPFVRCGIATRVNSTGPKKFTSIT